MTSETLLFTRADVSALLSLRDCITAVEAAFGSLGRNEVDPPGTLAVHAHSGGFHVKAGILPLNGRRYFAGKTNGNFPNNPAAHGLPTIQGIVLLCDADDGRVLAVMDSIEITALRTAAATGVAARYLARADSAVAAICGCGVQGRVQLRALAEVLPLRAARVHDADTQRARSFATEMSALLHIDIDVCETVAQAVNDADVCVTCTTATDYIVQPEHIKAGTFIAGVGVDSEHKRELAPSVLATASKVVTDLRTQCALIGDLHHAIEAQALTINDVHADLGDIVAGTRPAREHADEVIVFDSTGIALQDVAAAAAVYDAALRADDARGTTVPRRIIFA